MGMKSYSEDDVNRINAMIVPVRFAGTAAVPFPDPAEMERYLAEAMQYSTGYCIHLENVSGKNLAPMPIIQLEASARPDVIDLLRVFRTEGGQAPTPQIRYMLGDNPGMLLLFHFTDPVSCEFAVFLPWKERRQFLDDLAETGMFLVTTDDVRKGQIDTFWFPHPREGLQAAIFRWSNPG